MSLANNNNKIRQDDENEVEESKAGVRCMESGLVIIARAAAFP